MLEESRRARRLYWLYFALICVSSFGLFAVFVFLLPRDWPVREWLGSGNALFFIVAETFFRGGWNDHRTKRFRELAVFDRETAFKVLIYESGRSHGLALGNLKADEVAWISEIEASSLSDETALAAANALRKSVGLWSCAPTAAPLIQLLTRWIKEHPESSIYWNVRRQVERACRKLDSYHPLEYKALKLEQVKE